MLGYCEIDDYMMKNSKFERRMVCVATVENVFQSNEGEHGIVKLKGEGAQQKIKKKTRSNSRNSGSKTTAEREVGQLLKLLKFLGFSFGLVTHPSRDSRCEGMHSTFLRVQRRYKCFCNIDVSYFHNGLFDALDVVKMSRPQKKFGRRV